MMMLRPVLIALLLTVSPVIAHAADELCPDVADAKSKSPGSVAGVQEDIDRLTLCVERAKLLKQLDDLAVQRDDMLTKITDPALSLSGGIAVPSTIPGMSGTSLPALPTDKSGLSPAGAKPGDMRITGAAGNPLANAAPAPMLTSTGSWKVRKIWGQPGGLGGAVMRAQLTDGQGTLLNVVNGDTLPGGGIVESVSIKGVAVSQNGKTKDLSWDDSQSAGDSTNQMNGGNALSVSP